MDTTIFVDAVLSQDLEARRNVDVREKDVISLRTLSNKSWDYGIPTLTPASRAKGACFKPKKVLSRFFERYPCFKGVNMSNILIAGGSVVSCIFDLDERVDVDLFIYGISLQDVPARIEKLVRELRLPETGTIRKSANCTTISFGDSFSSRCDVQVIHRLYNSPSEVLHGFDLGSCAVGILANKKKVITTSLGRVSLEYKINILDLTKRSTTYESRLSKYFERGFRIVLPDLRMESLRKLDGKAVSVIMLEGMTVNVEKIRGNRIVGWIYVNKAVASDYESMDWIKNIEYRDNSLNQANLLFGRPLFYCREWKGIEDLVYALQDSKVTVEGTMRYCYPLKGDCINQTRLIRLFGAEKSKEYITRLLDGNRSEVAKDILIEYKAIIASLLDQYNAKGGYVAQWITVDPGSQISGSFHPRVVTKKEFYGPYLKK